MNIILDYILNASDKSFSGETIVHKFTIEECDKPTRKGKYISFQSGLRTVTFFHGINPQDPNYKITEFVN